MIVYVPFFITTAEIVMIIAIALNNNATSTLPTITPALISL